MNQNFIRLQQSIYKNINECRLSRFYRNLRQTINSINLQGKFPLNPVASCFYFVPHCIVILFYYILNLFKSTAELQIIN